MKKGRPGIILSALAERAKIDPLLDIIFRETTTLGVRIQPIERKKLLRSAKQVQTSFGIVSTKVITVDGKEQVRVEFEECKRIAAEKNLPLAEVYRRLEKEINS